MRNNISIKIKTVPSGDYSDHIEYTSTISVSLYNEMERASRSVAKNHRTAVVKGLDFCPRGAFATAQSYAMDEAHNIVNGLISDELQADKRAG